MIRGLATGAVNPSTQRRLLLTEAKLGLSLGAVLAVVAFFRVWLRRDDATAALAIGIASLVIVAVSAVVGASLPLLFVRLGIDPAHAGPAVEVRIHDCSSRIAGTRAGQALVLLQWFAWLFTVF